MIAVGLALGGLLLALYVLPGWVADRACWSEPVEPVRPLIDPDGPRILAALARRAGIDRSDP